MLVCFTLRLLASLHLDLRSEKIKRNDVLHHSSRLSANTHSLLFVDDDLRLVSRSHCTLDSTCKSRRFFFCLWRVFSWNQKFGEHPKNLFLTLTRCDSWMETKQGCAESFESVSSIDNQLNRPCRSLRDFLSSMSFVSPPVRHWKPRPEVWDDLWAAFERSSSNLRAIGKPRKRRKTIFEWKHIRFHERRSLCDEEAYAVFLSSFSAKNFSHFVIVSRDTFFSFQFYSGREKSASTTLWIFHAKFSTQICFGFVMIDAGESTSRARDVLVKN